VLINPVEGSERVGLKVLYQLRIAGPTLVFIQQDEEQRSGIAGAVVGRLRTLAEMRHFAKAKLVQDASRFFLGDFYYLLALTFGECGESRGRKFRGKGQHLIAGEQAVASEERHEPGEAGGGQRIAGHVVRFETEGRNVYQAAHIKMHSFRVAGQGGSL